MNKDNSKPQKDRLEQFIEKHPFIFFIGLGLTIWLILNYTNQGQKIYNQAKGYFVSPLNLECDSYDGLYRIEIYIRKPVYTKNKIDGSMLVIDYANNALISPATYNFKLIYQKDDYFENATIIQEGNYRVSLLKDDNKGIYIANGGRSIPLLCYKIINIS